MFGLRKRIKEIAESIKLLDKKVDKLIKRVSLINNENAKNTRPFAWLTAEERIKAETLKQKDPVTYEFVTECLKLFLDSEKER